jgi:hypothetical protein
MVYNNNNDADLSGYVKREVAGTETRYSIYLLLLLIIIIIIITDTCISNTCHHGAVSLRNYSRSTNPKAFYEIQRFTTVFTASFHWSITSAKECSSRP